MTFPNLYGSPNAAETLVRPGSALDRRPSGTGHTSSKRNQLARAFSVELGLEGTAEQFLRATASSGSSRLQDA